MSEWENIKNHSAASYLMRSPAAVGSILGAAFTEDQANMIASEIFQPLLHRLHFLEEEISKLRDINEGR